MINKKELLAKLIVGDVKMSYDEIIFRLEQGNELYRSIYNVPTNIFILGLIDSFTHLSLNGKRFEITLSEIKEFIPEIISDVISVEVTFTDEDWVNLEFLEQENHGRFKESRKFNTSKAYIGEFFEI